MNVSFTRCVNERERTIWQFVIVKNKLMSVFNASVLLLTMNLIVTATLTMLWRNSWSITGQTHEKLLPCASVSKRVLVQNHSYENLNCSDKGLTLETSLRWPIHIINPVDKTKLSCYTSHRRSTTVSLETYPSIHMKMSLLCMNGTHFHTKPRFDTEAKGKLEMVCSRLPEPNSLKYHNLPRFVFWDCCILQRTALSLLEEKNSSVEDKHKVDMSLLRKSYLKWLTVN